MPPRSRSKTEKEPFPTSEPNTPYTPKSAHLRPPDQAAVQKVVESAMARAQSSRGITPRGERTRVGGEKKGAAHRLWDHLFGNTRVVYNPEVTSKLTDAAGMFLVVLFCFYCTGFAYLLYRENALASH